MAGMDSSSEKSQQHHILWTHNAMNSHILTTCTEHSMYTYNHFLLADNSPCIMNPHVHNSWSSNYPYVHIGFLHTSPHLRSMCYRHTHIWKYSATGIVSALTNTLVQSAMPQSRHTLPQVTTNPPAQSASLLEKEAQTLRMSLSQQERRSLRSAEEYRHVELPSRPK